MLGLLGLLSPPSSQQSAVSSQQSAVSSQQSAISSQRSVLRLWRNRPLPAFGHPPLTQGRSGRGAIIRSGAPPSQNGACSALRRLRDTSPDIGEEWLWGELSVGSNTLTKEDLSSPHKTELAPRFVKEILCQIRKRHRSLLNVSEDVAFEIWCKFNT